MSQLAIRTRWLRSALSVAVLGFGLYAVAAGLYSDRTVVTESSDAGVVRTVTESTPDLTSGVVLAGLLVAIALVTPELAEFNVLGVSLKMKVAAAAKEAGAARAETLELKEEIRDIRVEIAQASASASAQATAAPVAHFYTNIAATEAIEHVRDSTPTSSAAPREQPTEHDGLTGQLINRWSELQSTLGMNDRLAVPITLDKDHEVLRISHARRAFVADRASDIRAARNLRNVVAHASTELSKDEIAEGIALTEALISDARRWIERY